MTVSGAEILSRLNLVAGVSLMLVAWTFAWRPTLNAELRQGFFDLRDRLFRLVEQGRIAPTQPLYVYLRSSMNSGLRYAEHYTFVHLVLGLVFFRRPSREIEVRFQSLVNEIPDVELRQELLAIRKGASKLILLHLLQTSPTAMLLTVVAIPLLLFAGIALGMLKKGREMLMPLEKIVRDAILAPLEAEDERSELRA